MKAGRAVHFDDAYPAGGEGARFSVEAKGGYEDAPSPGRFQNGLTWKKRDLDVVDYQKVIHGVYEVVASKLLLICM